jgi:hypothetical protein
MTDTKKIAERLEPDGSRGSHSDDATAASAKAAEKLRQLRGKVQWSLSLDVLRCDRR